MTATLQGYTTYRREALAVSGTGTFAVNIELRPGQVSETVTVSAEAPVVDVQSVTQQRVMGRDLLDTIPTGQTVHNMAALIPGMVIAVTGPVGQDVGGSTVRNLQQAAIHGGRTGNQRVMMDGLPLNTSQGNLSGFLSNMASTQEFTIDTSGVSAEDNSGGVRMNIVPREGGNTFRGSVFFTGATDDFQSSNYDDHLASMGFKPPNPPKTIRHTTDFNASFGGPVKRDTLWFYTAFSMHDDDSPVAGRPNLYRSNPAIWIYEPDPNGEIPNETQLKGGNVRATWQATTGNKVAFYYDHQDRCLCPEGEATISPESISDSRYPGQKFGSLTWTSVLSPKLLLDVAFLQRREKWGDFATAGADVSQIQVVDTVKGMTYHGQGVLAVNNNANTNLRAALSIITGAHAFKVGFMNMWGKHAPLTTSNDQHLIYTFLNGIPDQIQMLADPRESDNRILDGGLFVQDRWTRGRMTLSGGLRFDYLQTWFPAQSMGPSKWTPNRNVSIEKTDWVSWTDLTPRMGAVYDVFGNGRTALRTSFNKYLGAQSASGVFGLQGNPLNRIAATTNRQWIDADKDFFPDCDLLNSALNNECGPYTNQAFGSVNPATNIDPDLQKGFGVRGYNWEFQLGLQQQLMPRLSMDVAYVRRWYGNFTVTDNRAYAAGDYDAYTLSAPADARLPDGGSYPTGTQLFDLKPTVPFGRQDNLLTLTSKYGDQSERWHGMDLVFNLRMQNNLTVQGGMSTGNTLTDNCEILAQLPEIGAGANGGYCRVQTNYLTQVKGLATYIFPKIDVNVSASFQSIPGPVIAGNWNAPNSAIISALGRPLSGGVTNRPLNLIEPGTTYQERSNQVDFRVGKVFRAATSMRATVNVDFFNMFNANPVLTQNNAFATNTPDWKTPTNVLPGRLIKISTTLDF